MIIVGTYPDLDGPTESGSMLQQLRQAVDKLLPSDVIVHLLPPYPASGDGGFAANDWFSTRPALGCWHDLVEWAATRKLILDGIYNHVGFGHPWITEFFAAPREDGPIYAYRLSSPPSAQLSPRGGSVFRKYTIEGDDWYVWQTFSNVSFDIRLSLHHVQAEIRRHLSLLATSGIYGVRLDGCAYYGHDLSVEQFHNPSARLLAHSLAQEAQNHGLFVLAQLDIDPSGASYFPKAEGWSVPAVDYAYSAVLVLALLSESASAMEIHVRRTLGLPCNFIRPPRTHDGILLQSDMLTSRELADLAKLCDHWKLPVRMVDGERYEINSSLPFICSLGVDKPTTWQRILLVVALTGFLPGIPYFYLPFILCDIPESRGLTLGADPRSLNRTRLIGAYVKEFSQLKRSEELHALLCAINSTRALYSDKEFKAHVFSSDVPDSVFAVTRGADCCLFACNLSSSRIAKVQLPKKMRLEWGSRATSHTLGPLGFGVWTASQTNG